MTTKIPKQIDLITGWFYNRSMFSFFGHFLTVFITALKWCGQMRRRVGQQGGVGGGEQKCRNFTKDLTRVKKKVAQNSLGVVLFLNVLPSIINKETGIWPYFLIWQIFRRIASKSDICREEGSYVLLLRLQYLLNNEEIESESKKAGMRWICINILFKKEEI